MNQQKAHAHDLDLEQYHDRDILSEAEKQTWETACGRISPAIERVARAHNHNPAT